MEWDQAKDIILGFLASSFLVWLGSEIKKMRESLEDLNLKIALILRDVDQHEHRLNRLEEKHYDPT